jgi:hypothetical protein
LIAGTAGRRLEAVSRERNATEAGKNSAVHSFYRRFHAGEKWFQMGRVCYPSTLR